MTHPGREPTTRIDDMINKLDQINSEDEPKPAPTDFDDEMDHVLGAEAKAPETTKEETKPAQKRSNGKKDKAPAKKTEAKSKGKDTKNVKKDTKKDTKKVEKSAKTTKPAKDNAAPRKARPRDAETVEIQKQVVTMLKRAAGKPIAVSKIVEKLEGKGDKARDRQIRNALRGPQKDGLLTFVVVEGKKGFVKYIGA